MSYKHRANGSIISLDQYVDLSDDLQADYDYYEPPRKEWGREPDLVEEVLEDTTLIEDEVLTEDEEVGEDEFGLYD